MTFDIDNIERWRFCDNEADAERLLALVIDGRKTATSSLLREYREENEPIPQAGDLSAICHWDGRPACVVDTTAVEVVPFGDVTDEMAALEGECRTAEGWRRIHALSCVKISDTKCRSFTKRPSSPHMPAGQ